MYKDYQYNTADNPSGETGIKLANVIYNILATLTHSQQKTIIDIGCGNGFLANYLADKGYFVTGIEGSLSGIKIAQKQQHQNATFQHLELNDNTNIAEYFTLNSFDIVISSEVIEHLYTPSILFKTSYSLLKENGYIIFTTPYHGYLKNLIIALTGKYDSHHDPLWDGGHIKFFSVNTLSQLALQHKFNPIQFKFFGRLPLLWKSMILIAQKTF